VPGAPTEYYNNIASKVASDNKQVTTSSSKPVTTQSSYNPAEYYKQKDLASQADYKSSSTYRPTTTAALVANRAGVSTNSNGTPQINSATAAKAYMKTIKDLYTDIAHEAGINIDSNGKPMINSASDVKAYLDAMNKVNTPKSEVVTVPAREDSNDSEEKVTPTKESAWESVTSDIKKVKDLSDNWVNKMDKFSSWLKKGDSIRNPGVVPAIQLMSSSCKIAGSELYCSFDTDADIGETFKSISSFEKGVYTGFNDKSIELLPDILKLPSAAVSLIDARIQTQKEVSKNLSTLEKLTPLDSLNKGNELFLKQMGQGIYTSVKDTVNDKIINGSTEDRGEIFGRVVFDVGLTIATIGGGSAKTVGSKAASATEDAARVTKTFTKYGDDVTRASSITDDMARTTETLGDNVVEGGGDLTHLQKNKIQGSNFEQEVKNGLNTTQNNVVEQITIKTNSGVKTRIDLVGNDASTGNLVLTEAKSSTTAPLTNNQKLAFPEIAETGGVVVGKGKAPFVGGTQIPPTTVQIIRPE